MGAKLVIGAAVVVAFFVEELVSPVAENHPWRVVLLLGVAGLVCGIVVVVLWLFDASPAFGVTLALILLGGGGWGLVAGWDTRDNYLTPYCEYGARSQAQLDACLENVGSEDVDELDTPAARYARGETTECAAGAGPFCREL